MEGFNDFLARCEKIGNGYLHAAFQFLSILYFRYAIFQVTA